MRNKSPIRTKINEWNSNTNSNNNKNQSIHSNPYSKRSISRSGYQGSINSDESNFKKLKSVQSNKSLFDGIMKNRMIYDSEHQIKPVVARVLVKDRDINKSSDLLDKSKITDSKVDLSSVSHNIKNFNLYKSNPQIKPPEKQKFQDMSKEFSKNKNKVFSKNMDENPVFGNKFLRDIKDIRKLVKELKKNRSEPNMYVQRDAIDELTKEIKNNNN